MNSTRTKNKKLHLVLPVLICVSAVLITACCVNPPQSDETENQVPDEEVQPAVPEPDSDLPDTLDPDALQDQTSSPPLLNPPSGICDPAVTELLERGDLQILTGGPVQIVYYRQTDERWGNAYYGSDKISTHGCGPTVMSMLISSLTDTLIDPPSMAQWAATQGYWARRSGSYHRIVIGTAEAFGLHAEAFASRDPAALLEVLFSGKLLVALMGPGHFTQGGHFIILRGVTLSGDILVADPASPERSLMSWDPQLILGELSSSTADGSPLWLITLPEDTSAE